MFEAISRVDWDILERSKIREPLMEAGLDSGDAIMLSYAERVGRDGGPGSLVALWQDYVAASREPSEMEAALLKVVETAAGGAQAPGAEELDFLAWAWRCQDRNFFLDNIERAGLKPGKAKAAVAAFEEALGDPKERFRIFCAVYERFGRDEPEAFEAVADAVVGWMLDLDGDEMARRKAEREEARIAKAAAPGTKPPRARI